MVRISGCFTESVSCLSTGPRLCSEDHPMSLVHPGSYDHVHRHKEKPNSTIVESIKTHTFTMEQFFESVLVVLLFSETDCHQSLSALSGKTSQSWAGDGSTQDRHLPYFSPAPGACCRINAVPRISWQIILLVSHLPIRAGCKRALSAC